MWHVLCQTMSAYTGNEWLKIKRMAMFQAQNSYKKEKTAIAIVNSLMCIKFLS